MTASTQLYLVIAFLASMLVAWVLIRMWDSMVARFYTSKIIGSTKEEKRQIELMTKVLDAFSFNHEENRQKLIAAGIYNEFVAKSYYLFKFIPFLLVFLSTLYGFFIGDLEFTEFFMLSGIALVIFLIGPDAYVAARTRKNIKHISSRLPFLLDLMNVCVHTGMTIESSLEFLSKEIATVDENLAYVLRKTTERSRLVGLEKALEEFYEMVPTTEAQSFVMTLTQSLQYGSSVGPVLATLATDIREINMMELEEKIGKMGAKMSIPLIVFIMVPIVVLIAAPGIVRMLT
ncbi:Flp pilus assembly protein TadC [Vibrio nigripulchritudo]|uniref:Flp pilus assembly protein TadC n=1 Tax=Vibrio nigripulchritudo SOn1 TaxID=1238450 RepID=A0AAV2VUE2_9VIBR|nr:type II secretion system F family protein [Vibrio nigripulchritudo]BCL69521.1 Flp pilus assembly protein TadC [Vibrio nigripulchritudo]BDU30862.1 Flp pilus assembly protein TadC [Vibrio nigripulchritudo]CCO48025.1 putative Flp pilus assembly protein TadC [Vibrio nigripulchritudo SOn1]